MTVLRGFARGYRRLMATFVAPQRCPICLEAVPVLALRDVEEEGDEAHAKLHCRHRFCAECIRRYIEMKIRAREVDEDQLVCPVLDCKQRIKEEDMDLIVGTKQTAQYRAVLKRKRDEKNPSARWCPRPGCDELIICESTDNFTCPKCATVGCFRCRGYAHRFWFCRGEEDKSYLAWEASVGRQKAVRACPKCQMRIWKNEGCNHMTCTHCRYQYCWVCESTWDASHYACYDLPFVGASTVWGRWLQRSLGYAAIVLIVAVISAFGFYAFVGGYVVFSHHPNEAYVRYVMPRFDMLLAFTMRKKFRDLRFRRYCQSRKKLHELCTRFVAGRDPARTIVGFGDWTCSDFDGVIKKSPDGPSKRFMRELSKYCRLELESEYRTSNVHHGCSEAHPGDLVNQYQRQECRDGVVRNRMIYSVLHCLRNNGGCGITVNRDVNASRNILRAFELRLSGQPRPPELSRSSQQRSA